MATAWRLAEGKSGIRGLVKSVLATAARQLPWGGRYAVLDALIPLCEPGDLFVRLGRGLHVQDVTVQGANGTIAGPLWDMDSSGYGLLGLYATRGAWASELILEFERLFEKDGHGTFVDVGANIGLTTIPIAQNPKVRCFGFEPDPANFEFLARNIARNCAHRNVILRRVAVMQNSGFLTLALSPTNSGDHQIVTSATDRKTISVEAERLDDLVESLGIRRPIGVKIDTQGAEPAVFAGGQKLLSMASLVSLEFSPRGMRRISGDAMPMLSFLAETFHEGRISAGDSEETSEWRPIQLVVDELTNHWNNPLVGGHYFDVIVRK